jgi:uncharacterized phosphosugar-binding protein
VTAMVLEEYARVARDLIERVARDQAHAIRRAAAMVADTVAGGGVVFTFGTGHSHCIAEDAVYRAGGLVQVDAILEPSLTGTWDVTKSEYLERLEGFGKAILDHRALERGDLLVVISNSGRNAVPVELAMEARDRGIPVVAVTSLRYAESVASRHSSGRKLHQVADVVIDNGTELGDAAIHLDGLAQPVGPTSSIGGMFVIHALMSTAAEILLDRGITPDVWESGNLDGASERNARRMGSYRGRIRTW